MEEEARDNVQGRMDKKSLHRLIKRLEKDGQIKIFKSSKKINDENREVYKLINKLVYKCSWKFSYHLYII